MRRLVLVIITAFCQMLAFAQRGKVRPEWDIDGGNGYHSIDDDLYSFLLIVGLIVLYFVYIAIKGSLSRSRGNADYRDTRDRYSVTHLSIRQLNKEYNRYK